MVDAVIGTSSFGHSALNQYTILQIENNSALPPSQLAATDTEQKKHSFPRPPRHPPYKCFVLSSLTAVSSLLPLAAQLLQWTEPQNKLFCCLARSFYTRHNLSWAFLHRYFCTRFVFSTFVLFCFQVVSFLLISANLFLAAANCV